MPFIMTKLIKPLCLSIVIFGLYLSSTANPVDLQTAQSVAAKFMGTNDLQLSATYPTDKNIAAVYVFNTADGFVIVSADDCETPIIGYSHEGRFDPNNVPVQMEDYLQDFVERIQYGIENHIVADETTTRQWELVKATGRLNESKSTQAVEPLLTELWHQGCLYNNLCPTMSGPCGHAEAGCVAVAMGQIMHYWKYPDMGWGYHSYSNQGITLSADFGNTVYDWYHMPDSLTESSNETEVNAVATLLYHCGVAVDMEYNTNGSGASSNYVPDALKRYFNYSRRVHREKQSDYTNDEWLLMLKSSLDVQRPVLYSGHGEAGGHAFVCDGYDNNDLLHFNWGWGRANGYFALGNLNPIGYEFNENNYAVFDIIPQFEPWIVEATPYPPEAGIIEGTGGYHLGEQCTLTAVSNEKCEFLHWKKDGRVVSNDTTYSFIINTDVDDIEACFSYKPIKDISAHHAPDTNDVNSPYVSLSWNFDGKHEWTLLNRFRIDEENLVTTDGEYIYTAFPYWHNSQFMFGKYTMDGEMVEAFNIDGARPDGLTCDGNYFYCSKNTASYDICHLYRYDFNDKTLVDSTNMMNRQFSKCAYDAYYDGFWLLHYYPANQLYLQTRQGEPIGGTTIPSSMQYYLNGFGGFTAKDGSPHLLICCDSGIYDYDIVNGKLNTNSITRLDYTGRALDASVGKYDGKDAIYLIAKDYGTENHWIYIYEIACHLSPILHYRLYRADSEGNTVMLADEYTGTSFIDSTWNHTCAGMYRFGISEVYYNGTESEIIWSDLIEKTDYGIDENDQETPEQAVQKVFEDGQIIIIKNGKRYTITGQHLN